MAAEAYPFDLDVCQRCQDTFRRPTPAMIGGLAVKPFIQVLYRVKIGDQRAKSFRSRKGAYQSYARKRIRLKYPCPGHVEYNYYSDQETRVEVACGRSHYDGDEDRLWQRFVRWLVWHDRETRHRGRSPFEPSHSPSNPGDER